MVFEEGREMQRLCLCYFSPCGNVKKIVTTIGEELAKQCRMEMFEFDFTLPENRSREIYFDKEDLVLLGSPVYAGRIPNKIMPYIRDHIHGDGTQCVCIAAYGNRSFGDALSELYLLAKGNGFVVVAAAAVVSEHSFASLLASGRPNENDTKELLVFAEKIANKLRSGDGSVSEVPGANPPGSYYTPLRRDGLPAKFLKAVPQTDLGKCRRCGVCHTVCPMGSVDKDHPEITNGVCIKCQACIYACKYKARYFDDEDFLSHKQMLIENFKEQKENLLYL